MEEILKFAVANKASDVHLIADVPPKIRVNGTLLNVAGFEKLGEDFVNDFVSRGGKVVKSTEFLK